MKTAGQAPPEAAEPIDASGIAVVVFLALVALPMVLFLWAPWPLETKALAVLHGLGAQRPSRSLWFGRDRLPLGARMTGVYGGELVTQLYLLARGRLRAVRLPSLAIVAALGVFVALMAVDGLNSLAQDLGRPTAYPPSNALRLATGGLAGTTLGVALWLLLGRAIWAPALRRRTPVLHGWWDLLSLLGAVAALCLVAGCGWSPLFAPLAVLQVVEALLALGLVCLAVIEVGRGSGACGVRELAGPACGALLAAYLALLGSASLRAFLEAGLHLKELS